MTRAPWKTNYIHGTELLWRSDGSDNDILIGDGVVLPATGSRRFRVVDVWHSHANEGGLDFGTNVFLEESTEESHTRSRGATPSFYAPV